MVSIEESRAQIEQARSQVAAQQAKVAAAQRGIQQRIKQLPPTGTREALLRQRGIASIPIRAASREEKAKLSTQQEQISGYSGQISEVAQRVQEAEAIQVQQEKGLESLERDLVSQTKRIEELQQRLRVAEGDDRKEAKKDLEVQQKEVSLISEGISKVKAGFSISSIKNYIASSIDNFIARRRQKEEGRQAQKAQIASLEKAGFKPVYYKGKLSGFEDTITQQSISLENMQAQLEMPRFTPGTVQQVTPVSSFDKEIAKLNIAGPSVLEKFKAPTPGTISYPTTPLRTGSSFIQNLGDKSGAYISTAPGMSGSGTAYIIPETPQEQRRRELDVQLSTDRFKAPFIAAGKRIETTAKGVAGAVKYVAPYVADMSRDVVSAAKPVVTMAKDTWGVTKEGVSYVAPYVEPYVSAVSPYTKAIWEKALGVPTRLAGRQQVISRVGAAAGAAGISYAAPYARAAGSDIFKTSIPLVRAQQDLMGAGVKGAGYVANPFIERESQVRDLYKSLEKTQGSIEGFYGDISKEGLTQEGYTAEVKDFDKAMVELKTRYPGYVKGGQVIEKDGLISVEEPSVKIGKGATSRWVPISELTGKGYSGFLGEVLLGQVEKSAELSSPFQFLPKEGITLPKWIGGEERNVKVEDGKVTWELEKKKFTPWIARQGKLGKTVRTVTEFAPYIAAPNLFLARTGAKLGEAQFFGTGTSPKSAWEYTRRHPLEVGIAGAIGASQIGGKIISKYVPRKKYYGLTQERYLSHQEALGRSEKLLAQEQSLKAKFLGGRTRALGAGREAVFETKPWGYKGFGEKVSQVKISALADDLVERGFYPTTKQAQKAVTKQISNIADDLVEKGIYTVKKDAIKYITSKGITVQDVVTKLPDEYLITKGSLGDITRTIKAGPLKYSPDIGKFETTTFGIKSAKTLKGSTKGWEVQWQLGSQGRPIGQKFITTSFNKAGYGRADIFGPGRMSRAKVGPFVKETYPAARHLETQFFKSKQLLGKESTKGLYRIVKPEISLKYVKPGRVTPEEFLKIIRKKPPTPTQFKNAAFLRKEIVKDVVLFKPKKLTVDLFGARAGTQTLAGVSGKVSTPYVQFTKGIRDDLGLVIKKAGDSGYKTIIGGGKKSSNKYLQKLYEKTAPVVKVSVPPKIVIPRVSPSPTLTPSTLTTADIAPKMVGGLGKGVSEWYGKSVVVPKDYSPAVSDFTTKAGGGLGVVASPAFLDNKDIELLSMPVTSSRVGTGLSKGLDIKMGLDTGRKIKPALRPAIKSKFDIGLVPALKPALSPAIKSAVDTKLDTKVKPALKIVPKLALRPAIRPSIRPAPRTPVRPSPPRPPIKIIPFIIPRIKSKSRLFVPSKVKAPRTKGYAVEVRRKGKWGIVTPFALAKGEALALGRKVTKAGAEVSFRLVGKDRIGGTLGLKPFTEEELKKEYRGRIVRGKEVKKPLTFVQKRKARIATPGEFRAITAKGIAKRKKRKVKWLG